MFKGWVDGTCYYSWNGYKEAYNKAVLSGRMFDDNGNKVTKLLK